MDRNFLLAMVFTLVIITLVLAFVGVFCLGIGYALTLFLVELGILDRHSMISWIGVSALVYLLFAVFS